MNEIKRQLNRRMGDTKVRSEKIMRAVEHNQKQPQKKKTPKRYYVTFATFAALLVLLLYINPFETIAPNTSKPVTSEQFEQQLNLKNLFKQDGDVAHFLGYGNEYADFTETTHWLSDEFVQITVDTTAIETRKIYKITKDAIYLVFEDLPGVRVGEEVTVEKLKKMQPISTLLTKNLENEKTSITYPSELNTPLQKFEKVIQITNENEYGKTDFYYAENFGLIGKIAHYDGSRSIYSLIASINTEPSLNNLELPVTNLDTNEKETLLFEKLIMLNPLIIYDPQFEEDGITYKTIHAEENRELGLIDIKIPNLFSKFFVVRTNDSVNPIGSSSGNLVEWRYSPNKERIAFYYTTEYSNYEIGSIFIVNVKEMVFEGLYQNYERAKFTYPIVSYRWVNDTTIEYSIPDVNYPSSEQFVEWMNSEEKPIKTLLAEVK